MTEGTPARCPPPTPQLKTLAFVCNDTLTLDLFRGGIIRRFLSGGYEVHVLAPFHTRATQLIAKGAHFTDIDVRTFSTHPIRELRLLRRLHSLYEKIRPDLIFHFTIKINIYGTVAARRLGIPCVNVAPGLGTFPDVEQPLLRKVLNRGYAYAAKHAQEFWFLNEHDRAYFDSRGWLEETYARVLPGEGLDTAYYESSPLPERRSDFKVLFVGRLLVTKGARVFAEAAAIARERKLPLCFELVGFLQEHNPDAVTSDELYDWVHDGRLTYHGAADDTRPFYRDADIVVLPTHFREGLNRVIQEALSCGRPVVTTDVPGAGELVDHEKTGYLVPTDDPGAVVEALAYHFSLKPAQRAEMGRLARRHVVERYHEAQVHQHYFSAVARLANRLRETDAPS